MIDNARANSNLEKILTGFFGPYQLARTGLIILIELFYTGDFENEI
jgi:hypothetical protein